MTKKTVVKDLDAPKSISDTAVLLSVDHWRKRYGQLIKRFKNVTELANEAAPLDGDFAGITGWMRIRNIHANRGGLRITAKLVTLMEQLRPIEAKPKSRLSRQKLAKPSVLR